LPQPACEAHHDRERQTEEDELAAEREPAAEEIARIADLRDVMVPLPPEIEHAERQLDRPDEREAEHPEQHSRADRTGRGLPRPADSPPRIDREGGDLDKRRSPEEEIVDPCEARRSVELCCREICARIEMREME